MNGIQNPRSTDKESEIQSIPLSNAVIRNPQRGIQNLRLLGFTYIGRRSVFLNVLSAQEHKKPLHTKIKRG